MFELLGEREVEINVQYCRQNRFFSQEHAGSLMVHAAVPVDVDDYVCGAFWLSFLGTRFYFSLLW